MVYFNSLNYIFYIPFKYLLESTSGAIQTLFLLTFFKIVNRLLVFMFLSMCDILHNLPYHPTLVFPILQGLWLLLIYSMIWLDFSHFFVSTNIIQVFSPSNASSPSLKSFFMGWCLCSSIISFQWLNITQKLFLNTMRILILAYDYMQIKEFLKVRQASAMPKFPAKAHIQPWVVDRQHFSSILQNNHIAFPIIGDG